MIDWAIMGVPGFSLNSSEHKTSPAGLLPDGFEELPDVLQDDERGSEACDAEDDEDDDEEEEDSDDDKRGCSTK